MNTTVLPQLPYSPDLAQVDFFLFPILKYTLKGRRFQTIQEIIQDSQTKLAMILKNAYQDFPEVATALEWCINAGGVYSEGNKAHSVAGTSEKI
jgi:hypothetical protein